MPGPSWSFSASHCLTGSKLRQLPNTVCSKCYALKNRYLFPNVQNAMDDRLAEYNHNPIAWRKLMVAEIVASGTQWFRWFDSGDLQSLSMLRDICYVALHTYPVNHWLPTRETQMVLRYARQWDIPANLCVRISAHKIDGNPPNTTLPTSSVVTSDATCPAPTQGNQCGACRACWNPNVAHVSYKLH